MSWIESQNGVKISSLRNLAYRHLENKNNIPSVLHSTILYDSAQQIKKYWRRSWLYRRTFMKNNLIYLTKESLVEYMYKITFNNAPKVPEVIAHIHGFFYNKRDDSKYDLDYKELEQFFRILTRRQTSSHNFFCILNNIITNPGHIELSKKDFRHIFSIFPRWMMVEMTEKITLETLHTLAHN